MAERGPLVHNLTLAKDFGCSTPVRIPESRYLLVSAAGVFRAERLIIAGVRRAPSIPRHDHPDDAYKGMLRIGVLASHEGTTLQAIIDGCAQRRIDGRVVAVISNNSGSGALRRAAAAGIDTFHISSLTHPNADSLDAAICDVLLRARADVILLAGYMKRLGPRTLAAFPSRILNTHPALLPRFGGQGMFGDRVFEAVLAAGDSESGASVHLVDAEYDTGAVVRQERIPVLSGDTVESLKARVQACEREALVQTLAAIASGAVKLGKAG
jgi:phosphoribosylglycinamide formyltransferase 1